MKTVSPYLNFRGQTLEAFQHYQSIFGGELRVVRFKDMPGMNAPPHALDKVANVSLPPSSGETETLFAKLAHGGQVAMPLQETMWPERFGMCKDKFGVHWMPSFTGSKQFQPV